MEQAITTLIAAALVGGWTAMWLVWTLEGDARSWLASLMFPRKWLNGKSRKAVARLTAPGFLTWITNASDAPVWAVQLVSCRYCWSAHVAGTGTVVVALAGLSSPLLLPLCWASGAALGNIIYDRIKSSHSH